MTLTAIVESIIFAADSPLSIDRMADLLQEYQRVDIKAALSELEELHQGRAGGFHLVEVGGGWQFRTRPELQEYVLRQVRSKAVKFSPSALETLAIIAYRQPVTRIEVEHLRGVDCGGVLKTLLEKKLVRILGKKDIPGRPLIYGTSREFLEVFGLKDLKSLPTLKEIQALGEEPHFEQQEELPLGKTDGVVEGE
ncbi:SMC-Scp complex subunit ScpB [Geobacter sp. SVR]|uniref:SMC-Scp complex subunit ScpB n=1 Tax=Geobacter sp. SVR TaxID=2495594 RepID=UPI00143F0486|nr:SMC-Scp complex subunit ScpB [Geobacter sp. SVR]BCS53979.1 segregation and condensation protein B [Geobacter sp. SVR]GCF86240.1 segregation and condensation protein B [Geobacter sp. SVR]